MKANESNSHPPLKVAYRPSEVAKAIGIGLTNARKLIASGAIASVRIGKCVLVTEEAMRAFLAAAPKGGV
jgi:excisionase family DNA binding protein